MLVPLLLSAFTLASSPGYSEPAWSPDGKRIVAVHSFGKGMSGVPARAEIEVAQLSGRIQRRLTHGGGFNTGPAWSPDGRRIAFLRTSYDHAHTRLMVMRANGTAKRQVAEGRMSPPTWAPDSRRLAFVAGGRLRVLDIRSDTSHDLDFVPGTLAAWSPDGTSIAIGGGCTIYGIDADGTHLRPAESIGCAPELSIGRPTWSPDSSLLAFSECYLSTGCSLYQTNADALWPRSNWRGPSWSAGRAGPDPAWSPAGDRIAFTCRGRVSSSIFVLRLRRPGLARCGP